MARAEGGDAEDRSMAAGGRKGRPTVESCGGQRYSRLVDVANLGSRRRWLGVKRLRLLLNSKLHSAFCRPEILSQIVI